ncbi:MAG TPA: class I SAM-dependent methyltransferase [Ramlibacter sp.]|nr:class I SAM-dependent methyltransferase [Ramlibacter sp.]
MTKLAEKDYVAKIGEGGKQHSLDKPWSDPTCGENLVGMGTIMQLLPEPPARVLDLGCGAGWTSTFLALRGYEVVGQDIAPDMLALARENKRRYAVANLEFVEGDYEQLAFDNEFDAAMFYDCLHHSDDEAAALRAVYRALKPGGIVVTHEPGEGHSTNPASIHAMQMYGVNERDMPPWLIIKAARKAGFREWRVLPIPAVLYGIFYRPGQPAGRSRFLGPLIRRLKLLQPLQVWQMQRRAHRAGAIVVLTK